MLILSQRQVIVDLFRFPISMVNEMGIFCSGKFQS
jgi:hypothetical protein